MEQNKEEDFTGGITDFYLDPAPNKSAKLDNFLISKDRTTTQRCGSELYDVAYPRPVGVTTRIGKAFEFLATVFKVNAGHLWRYLAGTGWVELSGTVLPATDIAFNGATVANTFSVAQMNNHLVVTSDTLGCLPRKVYKDNGNVWRIFSAGLPRIVWPVQPISTDPNPTFAASTPAGKNFLYFFALYRTYTTSDGTVFEDIGPVTVVAATNMSDMTTGANSITIQPRNAAGSGAVGVAFPANSAAEFYDRTNWKMRIWRSKTSGTVGYYVGDMAPGDLNFVDSQHDNALGSVVYIDGDVLDWDPPPIAKYVVAANNAMWYAHVKELEGGVQVLRPFRVRQSIQFGPDKCPASFYTDVDRDITGIGAIGDYPIVFAERKFWRLEGVVDSQGNGFTRKVLVSDTVGCISSDSISQSQRGIAFAGHDGFYFTDGFNVRRVSDDLELTYGRLITDVVNLAGATTVTAATRKRRITGAYDRATDRYWFGVQTGTETLDNDQYVILDANFGLTANSPFTTASSGADLAPTASVFVDGVLLRGDTRGYLFAHRETLYSDREVSASLAAASWFTKAVPFDYMSAARSMGDSTVDKWAGILQAVFLNLTDLSVQPQTCDNDSADWQDLKELRFRSHFIWGQSELVWGEASDIWNYRSFIFFERRFPRGSLRFTYKQVRFKSPYTVILASGVGDDAAFVPGGATMTLTGLTNVFVADYVGYYVHYAQDGYTKAYRILSIAGNVATLDVSANVLVVGSYPWEIRGAPKGERVAMRNNVYTFERFFGNAQPGWRTVDKAGN